MAAAEAADCAANSATAASAALLLQQLAQHPKLSRPSPPAASAAAASRSSHSAHSVHYDSHAAQWDASIHESAFAAPPTAAMEALSLQSPAAAMTDRRSAPLHAASAIAAPPTQPPAGYFSPGGRARPWMHSRPPLRTPLSSTATALMRSPRGWAEALLQEDRQAAEVAAAQSSHDASTIRAAAEALSRQAADQQLPPSRFMDFVDQLAAGRVTVGSDGQLTTADGQPTTALDAVGGDQVTPDGNLMDSEELVRQWTREFMGEYDYDDIMAGSAAGPATIGRAAESAAGSAAATSSQEARGVGESRAEGYQFAETNPFATAGLSADQLVADGQEALRQGALMDAILLFDAACRTDANHAIAWELLGTSQAENEQEVQAIAALKRAVALDGTRRSAYLQLATSLTNEGRILEAYEAIQTALAADPRYATLIQRPTARRDVSSEVDQLLFLESRHEALTEAYLNAATLQPDQIDADLQVGLGLLFHIHQEYDKAVDCFKTAISVRPDDFHLWNKLGAALANSNRSAESVEIYRRALELRPGYIRARYNLGVSCVNLRAYHEACEHFLTALSVQAQGARSEQTKGTARSHGADVAAIQMSETIWSSLKL